MKIKAMAIFLSSILASASAFASDDFKCTLDSGDVMTLSHVSSTVYIEFIGVDDDPDEGGSVIKLDIASGGAQQSLNESAVGSQSFTLRGTDDDIDGAIAVVYEKYDGKESAYYTLMNTMGKEVVNLACKPTTIQARNTLLTNGIVEIAAQQQIQSNDAPAVAKSEPKNSEPANPFKIWVGERLFEYGTIKTPYRTVNITSTADNLIINEVTVNRNQCSASIGNPKKPIELPFGATATYDYNIQHRRCDVVEIVVKTNKGDLTFQP